MEKLAGVAGAHPLQATADAISGASEGRLSHMQGANEGPAQIASKISGYTKGGLREDNSPYFTNNEGHPFPDPAHSKTVGGLPLVSDTFLLQKQQTFNRSKNLERKNDQDAALKLPLINSHRHGTPLWKWSLWLLRGNRRCYRFDQGILSPRAYGSTAAYQRQRPTSSAQLGKSHPCLFASRPSLLAASSPILHVTLVGLQLRFTLERATTTLSD